jgi:probable rRNA maturation factor
MIAFDPIVPEGCDAAPWLWLTDQAVLDRIGRAITTEIGQRGQVAVALADDRFVQGLNARFRRIDRPTNVLSFPSGEDPTPGDRAPVFLGDVALAAEMIAREAADGDLTYQNHAAHLLVHGTLHLLGHDHMQDSEAEVMEALETRIVARLGIPDPYAR